MPSLEALYATLIAAVPTLLAAGAVSTAVNQLVQRYLASRLPRLAHVCNTLTVDYIAAVAALARFVKPTPPSQRGASLVLPLFLVAALAAVFCFLGAMSCSKPPTPAETARAIANAQRAAVALCVLERAGGLPDAKAADIARQFCATDKQLAPFLAGAVAELGDAGAP